MQGLRTYLNFADMIIRSITRNQVLPFYKAKKYQQFRQSDACLDVLVVPANQIPSFQIISAAGQGVQSMTLMDACDDTEVVELIGAIFSDETLDYDGDGTDERIQTIIGADVDPGASGYFYIRAVVDTGGEGNETWYSEAFKVGCDYDYIIRWSKDCAYKFNYYAGGFKNLLYIQSDETRPEYEKIIEGAEDGRGELHQTYYRNRKFIRLEFAGADFLLDALNSIEHHNEIEVYDVAAGEWREVDNFTVIPGGDEDDVVYPVTVRFSDKLDAEDACTDCDIYDGAPFGTGDYPTNPRNPNNSPDPEYPVPNCDSFAVAVARVGNELRATVSGSPGGCTNQITWYLNGDQVGQGSTILLGNFGVYTAEAICGGCVAENSYTYLNGCANLSVSLSEVNGLITANVTGNTGSPSYVWYRIEAGVPVQVASGSNTHQAAITGIYQVQVNDGPCQVTESIYVNLESCTISATISQSGDELTIAAVGCSGGITYSWSVDRGDGAGFVALAETSDTLDTGGLNGTYKGTVSCDGCTADASKTIINCEYQQCQELTIAISKVGNQLNAIVSGCNGSALINWEKSGNGTYQHIGAGASISINSNGNYRATVTCGNCTAVAELPVLDCEECNLTVTITESMGIITAGVTGCAGTPSYVWEYIGANGPELLPDTDETVTLDLQGIYKVTVTCDGCESIAYYHYCEGENCGEVTQGTMAGCN